MRRFLLSAAAALALSAGEARAQAIVNDPINLVENAATAVSTAKTAGEMVAAVQQLRRTYTLLDNTYQAIAHTTDLRGAARALGGASRWALPEGSQVPDLLTALGRGSWGRAAALIDGSRAHKTEEPELLEYQEEMDRRERITSNVQSIVLDLSDDIQRRIEGIDLLLDRAEEGKDGTENAAVANLIALEGKNMQAHRDAVMNAQVMLMADDRVTKQRDEQRWARDVEETLRRTRSALSGW